MMVIVIIMPLIMIIWRRRRTSNVNSGVAELICAPGKGLTLRP